MQTASGIDVSVVLPTLNGARFIESQLRALAAQQTSRSWEVIVVDGGSEDATVELVRSFRIDGVPMHIVELSGAPGINAGLNAGVRVSRGSVVLVAEQDDVVGDGWIEALAEALRTDHLVGSRRSTNLLNEAQNRNSRAGVAEDVFCHVPFVTATGMGFRRSLWNELGGFDEEFRYGGNDVEFCFRAARVGHPAEVVPDAVVHTRNRDRPLEAFVQGRAYGQAWVQLYAAFGEDCLSRRPPKAVAREWLRLGYWFLRCVRAPEYRFRLAYRLGVSVGFVFGSWKYRVLFL